MPYTTFSFQVNPNEAIDYGFCWDNVQLQKEAKHCSTANHNEFLLMAMTFAVRNRLSFNRLSMDDACAACDIPPLHVIPTNDVSTRVQGRMQHLVVHILVKHLPWANHLTKNTTPPIRHRYSEEMRKQTTVVSYVLFMINNILFTRNLT